MIFYTILINSIAVFLVAYLLKGVEVKSFLSAVWVAVGLAIVNAVIKPIIVFLTLPVTILTLGLFVLVIDALMVMLIDGLMENFKVENFWWALLFSVALSVTNGILFWLV